MIKKDVSTEAANKNFTRHGVGSSHLDRALKEFRQWARQIQALAADSGVRVIPYFDPSLPYFSRLNPERQDKTLEALKVYVDVCDLALSKAGHLRSAKTMAWAALRKLGLTPSPELFHFIEDADVIEVHDAQGTQLFRNFEFFNYCSYSLEELYCFSWEQLYHRAPQVTDDLLQMVQGIYAGELKGCFPVDLPLHDINERYSPLEYVIQAQIKYASPLYAVGSPRVAATLVVEAGALTGPELSSEEEEQKLASHGVVGSLLELL